MTTTKLQETIINNLNKLNNEHNISLRQLSSDTGFSESYMQKIFSHNRALSLATLEKLAERYELSPSVLLEDDAIQSAKIQQITDYLVTFDDESLNAILTIIRKMS